MPRLQSLARTLGVGLSLASLLIVGLALLFSPPAASWVQQTSQSRSAHQQIEQAWQLAQRSGRYSFTTQVEQVTLPAPSVSSAGRAAETRQLYFQGSANLAARRLELTFWDNGGTPSDPDSGVMLRVEGDRAYGRVPGGEWQELPDAQISFLPDNDPTIFLATVRNVRDLGVETRSVPAAGTGELRTLSFRRFSFDVDRPALAALMRERLEQRLREAGELPAGLNLGSAEVFRTVGGGGEVWIDPDGLPVRIATDLEFPEQAGGERVSASIVTDLSGYDRSVVAPPSPLASPLGWAGHVSGLSFVGAEAWRALGLGLGAIMLAAAMVLGLIAYARARRVYAAVAIGMSLIIVVGPLFQAQQVHAFNESQAAGARARAAEQAADAQNEAQREALFGPAWDPHASPAEQPAAQTFAAAATAQKPGLNPAGDPDKDGLTNGDEVRLGTNPQSPDSDGDRITDNAEVAGFNPTPAQQDPSILEQEIGHKNNELWYSDPNQGDSDSDGLLDAAECPERVSSGGGLSDAGAICRDSDKDGVPDIFDLDNDNDGLINKVDLSPDRWLGSAGSNIEQPITGATPFSQNSTLKLLLKGLQKSRTVLVDLQLRPKEREHLTYAMNVLDWPSGDTRGQIQRTRDTTLPDVAGDMQLLPMLEVTIPFESGRYGNLPVKPGAAPFTSSTPIEDWLDKAKLDEYQIVASKLDNGELALYVPLSLVTDETGEHRIGFSARLLYTPSSDSWGKEHALRLVWVIQMKTDSCDSKNMPATVRDNSDPSVAERWCRDNRVEAPQPSIVHRYFDEWYLTGMSVQEEHGTDTAILYEDPAKDTAETPDSLIVLAESLGKTFIVGRDCDTLNAQGACQGDGKRDITVAAMPGRFDHTLNANLKPPQRAHGLLEPEDDGGRPLNVVRVDRKSYPNQSAALIDMAGGRVKDLLNSKFSNARPTNPPLLMFAMESSYRSLNLGDRARSPYANGVLSLDASGLPVAVEATLNWKAYERTASSWSLMEIGKYFDLLNIQYQAVFKELDPQADSQVIAGQAMVAASYHIAMYQGQTGFPQLGGRIIQPDPTQSSDILLAQQIAKGAKKSGKLVKKIVAWAVDREADESQLGKLDKIKLKIDETIATTRETINNGVDKLRTARAEFYRALGSADDVADVGRLRSMLTRAGRLPDGLTGAYRALSGTEKTPTSKRVSQGALVGAVALTAIMIAVSSGDTNDKLKIAASGLGLVLAVKGAYDAYEVFKGIQTFTRGAKIGAVVGLVIEVAAAVGLLIYTAISAGLAFGSLEFNQLLAETVGTIIVAVLLFALLFVPVVGQLIVAIIAVIDALIAVICKAFNLEDKGTAFKDWICKGISGIAAKLIAKTLYGQTDVVVMNPPEGAGYQRLDISGARPPTFANPALGLVAGQRLTFAHAVSNTLRLTDPLTALKNDPKLLSFYPWLFTERTLRSSTFTYALQPTEKDLHDDLERGGHPGEWIKDGESFLLRRTVKETFTLSAAGVNQGLGGSGKLFLSEAYAYPVAECIGIPLTLLVECHLRTTERTDHIPVGNDLYYDVFPAELTGFYEPKELVPGSGGYAPLWGLNGSPAFQRQKDFDGDGLLNRLDGGNDPDDSRFDTDGDRLPDKVELGLKTDPRKPDSDGDGLSDAYERQVKTSPLRSDSDGDGMLDGDELRGWAFVYGLNPDQSERVGMVTSDPNQVDADGDQLTDYQEFVLGTNPRVTTDQKVLDFQLSIREKNAPVALLTLDEPGGTSVYGNLSLNGSLANAICAGGECPAGGLSGYSGNGVRFDGPAQALGMPALDLGGELTLAAWVRAEAGGGDQPILASGDGRSSGVFLRLRDGFYEFGAVNGGVARAPAGDTSVWSHVAGSYDGATWRLFRDGQEVASAPGAGPLRTLSGWAIGGYAMPGPSFFQGAIDEVAIFNQGLEQAQVAATQARRYNQNDGVVRPGDSLVLAGSARNLLLGRYLKGLLRAEAPAGTFAASVKDRPLILQPNAPMNLSGELQVANNAPSLRTTLNQVASGQVVDVRLEAGNAQLWLTFNTQVSAGDNIRFPNQSGDLSVPPGVCLGSACPTIDAGGRVGGAASFDGVNDVVTVGKGAPEEPYSFAVWFRTSTPDGGIFTTSRTGSTSDARDRQVYLKGGNVCATVMTEEICTSGANYADGSWHHLVHTFGGAVGGQRIYLDANQRASGSLSASVYTDDTTLIIGSAPGRPLFRGELDELRLFEKALPETEINNLAEKGPFFENSFTNEQGEGYDQGGKAVLLTGQNALKASEANLSNIVYPASFTLSMAIFPAQEDQGRGIYGWLDGNNTRPTLIQYGRQLEFRMGNGSQVETLRTGDVLKSNQWNPIHVTFDGQTLSIYVNGALAIANAADFAGFVNSSQSAGDVGRINIAQLEMGCMKIIDEADGPGDAEIYVEKNGQEIWDEGSLEDDDERCPDAEDRFHEVGDSEVKFEVWESDDNEPTDDDFQGEMTFNWWAPGEYKITWNNDGQGFIPFTVRAETIPFVGRIDELKIYDYAFSAERVVQASRAATTPLYLRLDDPTGSSGFANVNGVGNAGCTVPSCPVAGKPGRAGQAAEFDGDDMLSAQGELNREAHAVAFWFKTSTADGGIFAMANTADGSDSNDAQVYLSGGQLCANVAGVELCAGSGLNDGRWHHAAHTFSAGGRAIYIDGVRTDGSGGTSGLSDQSHALIGAAPGSGEAGFVGTLDAVQVFNGSLDGAAVDRLRRSVPALKLGFNEPEKATSFADDTGGAPAGCAAPRCPELGVEARFGLAAAFDGKDDVVSVTSPFPAGASQGQMTVEAWINSEQPVRAPGSPSQTIVNQSNAFQMALTPEGKLAFALTGVGMVSDLALKPNIWYHVVGSYDGATMRLYINGTSSQNEQRPYSGGITSDSGNMQIGALTPDGANAFKGRIEQVTLYALGRPEFEVRDTFELESRWFEQRERYPLTVDADKPTATLRLDGDAPYYRDGQTRRLLIEASDPTSRVMGVEWSINGTTWAAAPQCRESAGRGTAWCPEFNPRALRGANVEGSYVFRTRAYDLVDNQGDVSSVTFVIDTSGPSVESSAVANSTLPVRPNPLASNSYIVKLAGTASDPNLSSGGPGSGVSDVYVTLIDQASGLPLGPEPQRAALDAGAWSLDYTYDVLKPNGSFTLQVEAIDRAGNRTSIQRAIRLETTPPATTIATANLPDKGLVGPRTVQGGATDPGTPASGVARVDIAFKEYGPGSALYNEQLPAGAQLILGLDDNPDRNGALVAYDLSGQRRNGSCAGANCPNTGIEAPTGVGMGFNGQVTRLRIAPFTIGGSYSLGAWIRPATLAGTRVIAARSDGAMGLRIQDGQYRFGPVSFAAPASDRWRWVHLFGTFDGTTFRLYRNGVEVASAPAGAVPGSASLPWTVGGGSVAGFFAGGLDALLLYGRDLGPEEIQAIYAGSRPRLLISFEREFFRGGDSMSDSSGRQVPLSIRGGPDDLTNKSMPGGVDNFAMAFDGDDRVVAPMEGPAGAYGISFWFRTSDPEAGLLGLTQNADGSGDHRGYYLIAGRICVFITAAEVICSGASNFADNRWHHIVHTFGGPQPGHQLYADGALALSGGAAGFDLATRGLILGETGIKPLAGALDEVRVYDRALSEEEAAGLALASWRIVGSLSGASWSYALPAGLEGNYQINLRGLDKVNNIERRGTSPWAWRGPIDTLAPRVEIARTSGGGNHTFTVTARDYNLNPNTMVSPCGAARPLRITAREYYEAPWMSGLAGRPIGRSTQVVGLTATCTVPTAQATGTATVRDLAGNTRTVTFGASPVVGVEEPLPLTLAAADAAPAAAGSAVITVTTTAFNRNDYHASGFIDLTGTVSDTAGVASVAVSVSNQTQAYSEARLAGTDWSFPWYLSGESLPDPGAFTATFSVTNSLGELTVLTRDLSVDLQGPRILTPTITVGGAAFSPGMVVRSLDPEAVVTMPAISDGGGVATVWYGWLPAADYNQAALTSAASAPPTASQTLANTPNPNGGAAWYFHLLASDSAGNLTAERYGPVYYDPAPAPDYVSMQEFDGPFAGRPFPGWLNNSCTILGSDDRAARAAPAGSALALAQGLALSWDAAGLRMAWGGADWERDGDLFIYLDTVGGGSASAHNPSGGATSVSLPSGVGAGATPMEADYAVWVEDAASVHLLAWDGAAWQEQDVAAAGLLYRLDGAAEAPLADLYLPFAAIGMAGPTGSLDVVAFASEDAAAAPLRLWAAIPAANPLNSGRVVRNAPAPDAPSSLGLTDRYRVLLDSDAPFRYGFGVAEGGSCRRTSDRPRFSVSETAAGIVYDPADDSARLAAPDPSAPDLRDRLSALFDVDQPPVAPGTTISYTVSYENNTIYPLNNVHALVESADLSFSGCNLLSLGNLAPGATGSKTISAVSGPDDVGVATVTIYAGGQNGVTIGGCKVNGAQPGAEIARFLVLYTEDNEAPVNLVIDNLPDLVPAGPISVSGSVEDAAPVPTIRLDVNGSVTSCTDPTPTDGNWTCPLNLGSRADGDLLSVTATATDAFGQTSDPSPAVQTTVDDVAPPVVTIDQELLDTFDVDVGLAALPTLYGTIEDNRWVGPVLVCDANNFCNPSNLDLDPDAPLSASWDLPLEDAEELDNVAVEYTLYGTDRAGNKVGNPIRLSFTVDNVPPVITSTQGLSITGVLEDVTGLSGTISDGGGVEQMYVTVVSPADEIYQAEIAADQGAWAYTLTHRDAGLYEVYVTGIDRSGNTHTLGPIQVNVQPLNTLVADLSIDIAPPGGPVLVNDPFSYTITISNTGPAAATNTVFTTTLDPGITLVSLESSVGSCDGAADPPRCDLGTVAVSGTVSITLTATIAEVGTYQAVARVESELLERVSTDNTDSAEVTAELHRYHFPWIENGEPVTAAPDLVVESISTEGGQLLITIANAGTEPVTDTFWVDLYINPSVVPIAVNQTWERLGARGAAWGITRVALPLDPGERLTLAVEDRYYAPERSGPGGGLVPGDRIYVQVDSANTGSSVGGVRERHEIDGEPYNNIAALTVSVAVPLPGGTVSLRAEPRPGLPRR